MDVRAWLYDGSTGRTVAAGAGLGTGLVTMLLAGVALYLDIFVANEPLPAIITYPPIAGVVLTALFFVIVLADSGAYSAGTMASAGAGVMAGALTLLLLGFLFDSIVRSITSSSQLPSYPWTLASPVLLGGSITTVLFLIAYLGR